MSKRSEATFRRGKTSSLDQYSPRKAVLLSSFFRPVVEGQVAAIKQKRQPQGLAFCLSGKRGSDPRRSKLRLCYHVTPCRLRRLPLGYALRGGKAARATRDSPFGGQGGNERCGTLPAGSGFPHEKSPASAGLLRAENGIRTRDQATLYVSVPL